MEVGDFIYSRLFAWQGSFGVIPQQFDGAFVSGEFPIFEVDPARADARFLVFWFGLPESQKIVEADCFGSTPGTRNRYKEAYFLNLSVPLPPLDEQRRIVTRLDRIAELIEKRRQAIAASEAELQALLSKAFKRAIHRTPLRSMAEVAPLVRRPVEIEPDKSYPELGVRSFGRGTFHKPALDGAQVGTKKLFHIEPGDLVFNIVFAWEGAVAVVQSDDKGRVGSHRFLTCVTAPNTVTADFLQFYFLTHDGLQQLGEASPGGAGRNRTLGLKKLEAIKVPVPPIGVQHWFDHLLAKAYRVRRIRDGTAQDIDALPSAMLREVFGGGNAML
ncbi:MAG: restriction endonuclease subunit S [Rhodospirillaceae bacterium]|nr:restriction endonuclease subunit S [Rhodospirillaceae bacterium]